MNKKNQILSIIVKKYLKMTLLHFILMILFKLEWLFGCVVRWRCIFVSESSATTEILVRLPQALVSELDGLVNQENCNRSELIYQATKMYLRERKKRQIRESMRRGYMEMAKINLNIASEAFLAEYEADHTVERLVSGG